jgi:deoxyribose-phosphate aldolase
MKMTLDAGTKARPDESGPYNTIERWIQDFLSTFAESQIPTPVTQPVKSLAAVIDHTLLKADATSNDIIHACHEAIENSFATVCVNSRFIPLVTKTLGGSAVKPIAVVGFPLGAASSSAKAFEAYEAVREGAREIDMVIAIGALKEKDYDLVLSDIQEVVKACAEAAENIPVKVILETGLLSREEKIAACLLAKKAGAAFVKTSTGFASGGATTQDVLLMRKVVGSEMGVKASGGIRTREDALKMIEAGANRIGASASVAIVKNTAKSPESGLY